jgi:hypothetical protein
MSVLAGTDVFSVEVLTLRGLVTYYVLFFHDRDTKCCQLFRNIIESGDVKTLPLPVRSPNLNAFAERRVKSVKDDCLSKLILFGEASVRRALVSTSSIIMPKYLGPTGNLRYSEFSLVSTLTAAIISCPPPSARVAETENPPATRSRW